MTISIIANVGKIKQIYAVKNQFHELKFPYLVLHTQQFQESLRPLEQGALRPQDQVPEQFH